MSHLTLFSPHNLALLSDWLTETGELYVDVYWPHSASSSAGYFIRSMSELKSLISQQTWPEISIHIFRQIQYPLRGIADERLLEQALQQITDGQPYAIVSLALSKFPSYIAFWGLGKSHAEFRRDFTEVLGEEVGIGQEPFDIHDKNWFHFHTDEVFVVSVSKNQNYYEPYAREPERYKWLETLWQE